MQSKLPQYFRKIRMAQNQHSDLRVVHVSITKTMIMMIKCINKINVHLFQMFGYSTLQ